MEEHLRAPSKLDLFLRGCFQIDCPKRVENLLSLTIVPPADSQFERNRPRGAPVWRGRGALSYVTSDLRRVARQAGRWGSALYGNPRPVSFSLASLPKRPGQPCRLPAALGAWRARCSSPPCWPRRERKAAVLSWDAAARAGAWSARAPVGDPTDPTGSATATRLAFPPWTAAATTGTSAQVGLRAARVEWAGTRPGERAWREKGWRPPAFPALCLGALSSPPLLLLSRARVAAAVPCRLHSSAGASGLAALRVFPARCSHDSQKVNFFFFFAMLEPHSRHTNGAAG